VPVRHQSPLNRPRRIVRKRNKKKKRRRGKGRGIIRRKKNQQSLKYYGKKKSIFFRLPYWKDNLLRHNLDVMHIEKNVMDNILGTILDIKGKTKDNLQARQDLQEIGLIPKLHSYIDNDWRMYLPSACHTMSTEDKTAHSPHCRPFCL
jgi:hypothetical protein